MALNCNPTDHLKHWESQITVGKSYLITHEMKNSLHFNPLKQSGSYVFQLLEHWHFIQFSEQT